MYDSFADNPSVSPFNGIVIPIFMSQVATNTYLNSSKL